jgi:hypothetical protein
MVLHCGVRSGITRSATTCLACLAVLLLELSGISFPEDIGPRCRILFGTDSSAVRSNA